MSGQIWGAVIAAISALLVASFTYWSTKRRDREADWRKLKLEMYREFTTALAAMAEAQVGGAVITRFITAANALHLIAPVGVVNALECFRQEVKEGNPNKSQIEHDRLLSCLFWEMRLDLGNSPADDLLAFKINLWTSGSQKES